MKAIRARGYCNMMVEPFFSQKRVWNEKQGAGKTGGSHYHHVFTSFFPKFPDVHPVDSNFLFILFIYKR